MKQPKSPPDHPRAACAWTALLLAGLAGCFSDDGRTPNCPNMPIATGVVGQPDFSTGAANSGGIGAATLSAPFGSIATNGGLTYLADTGNNRILGYRLPPAGIGQAADFELGQGDATGSDFAGNGAGVGLTSFSAPSKATVSADGRLVVADTGNNRVLIWNTLPTANVAPDVVVGQPDFNSSRANQRLAAPTAATLNGPTAAAIANGMLIVADRENHRVLIWNAVPTVANTPADVELGQAATRTVEESTESCSSNSGPAAFCFGTAAARADEAAGEGTPAVLGLSSPSDLWTDGLRLLVSDSGNNRVLYWSQVPFLNNTFYSHFIGQAQPEEGAPVVDAAHLDAPWGLHAEGGTLFVADTGHNRVLAFSAFPVRNGASAFGVFGQADFVHAGANDSDQNGTPGAQQGGESSFAPKANTLSSPTGVFARSGELYVADFGNHRVVTFPAAAAVNGSAPSSCNGINPQVD